MSLWLMFRKNKRFNMVLIKKKNRFNSNCDVKAKVSHKIVNISRMKIKSTNELRIDKWNKQTLYKVKYQTKPIIWGNINSYKLRLTNLQI